MSVFSLHRFTRLYGVVGQAIAGIHEIAFEFFIENFNFG